MDPRWSAIDVDGMPLPGGRHPAMRTLASGASCREILMGVLTPGGLDFVAVAEAPGRSSP